MPGPTSDGYDPEWGTGSNAYTVREALAEVYDDVAALLGGRPPMYVLDLIRADLPDPIVGVLTERQWRLVRFALERAEESI